MISMYFTRFMIFKYACKGNKEQGYAETDCPIIKKKACLWHAFSLFFRNRRLQA